MILKGTKGCTVAGTFLLGAIVICSFVRGMSAAGTGADGARKEPSFDAWKSTFAKKYSNPKEEQYRKEVYANNVKYIEDFNSRRNRMFNMSVNQFADLKHNEFVKRKLYLEPFDVKTSPQRNVASYLNKETSKPPDYVDWSYRKAVSSIKDEGECRSSWAFAAAGAVEGQETLTNGRLLDVSTQQLIDCSSIGKKGNRGCDGGRPTTAFKYLQGQGAMADKDYMYRADYGSCSADVSKYAVNVTRFYEVPRFNESALKQAVAVVGPLAVMIDASQRSFQFYHEGIYYDPSCKRSSVNHAMLIIGYGIESNHGAKNFAPQESLKSPVGTFSHKSQRAPFWLLKGSWGRSWGQNGFLKLINSDYNECGISSFASFPVVAKNRNY
eukprot:Nk52_evm1s1198 gene=Nk52_evmTU1s1198